MTIENSTERDEEVKLTNATETRLSKTNGHITGIRDNAVVLRALENACRVAEVCDANRGYDTIVLDTTQITPLFDYFVLTTGKSRRQLRAIADQSDDVLAEVGSARRSTSGYETEWICHDYGDVVLHVFSPAARDLYDLENLWADAPRVDWQAAMNRSGLLSKSMELSAKSGSDPLEA